MIQLRLTGGPLGDRRGYYNGPDEQTVTTLYATRAGRGEETRLAADRDGAFSDPNPAYVYRRTGEIKGDVVFEYQGEAEEL